jgi:hypothetical protein
VGRGRRGRAGRKARLEKAATPPGEGSGGWSKEEEREMALSELPERRERSR